MSFSSPEDWEDPLPPTEEPRYANEDTSPTTERELKGWYAYPIAAEVNLLSHVPNLLGGARKREKSD